MPAPRARSKWAELLDLTLDAGDQRPLFMQIYLLLRDAIASESLAAGSKLPSSRALAERLGVSRTSVISAFEQLLAEGFIEARTGSGTFVADDVPAAISVPLAASPTLGAGRRDSHRSARYRAIAEAMRGRENKPFAPGCSSVDATTIAAWRRIAARQLQTIDTVNLHYADPRGEEFLRVQVAEYLRAARGVRCDAEQIIIVSGAQQAIDLSLRSLLDPGDEVWLEDPGYLATRAAVIAADAQVIPVPVDSSGLIVSEGLAAAANARAAYITPSHQYPTGAVMTMARRLELLSWAQEKGAWIIEDDYDSEFRYVGRPLASLQGLDRDARVIYVGTLSKVLFPGVRMGFAVVPRDLVDVFVGARLLTDRQPPTTQQSTVAEFMRQGFLTSHIRRMRQRYREARDILIECVSREMGDLVDAEVPECGIQLIMHFKHSIADVEVARRAAARGIVVRPVSPLYIRAPARSGLVLGYSGFSPHQLRASVAVLASVVREVAPSD
jgi:GntR family transcriptional regulator/MocR family aminotransferase